MVTRKFFRIALIAGLLVLGGVFSASAGNLEKININTATVQELAQLTGVGPNHAAGIVKFRQQNGPFKTPAALMQVSGIGPKTFEKNKAVIVVEDSDRHPSKK